MELEEALGKNFIGCVEDKYHYASFTITANINGLYDITLIVFGRAAIRPGEIKNSSREKAEIFLNNSLEMGFKPQ